MDESSSQAAQAPTGADSAIDALGRGLDDLTQIVTAHNADTDTLLSGLATLQMFSLVAQLLLVGVTLVVVFVVALRRF